MNKDQLTEPPALQPLQSGRDDLQLRFQHLRDESDLLRQALDSLLFELSERIKELETDKADLLAFLAKFLDNFKSCDVCSGRGEIAGDECFACHATGKQLESIGVLYVELIEQAGTLMDAIIRRGDP